MPGPPVIREVGVGLYAYVQPDGSWFINTTGFLVGPDGVVAVDACSTERRTRALQEAIAKVTPEPVRTLINTHWHGDHTHGNGFFPTATIVAHERTRQALLAAPPPEALAATFEVPEWGTVRPAPPFLTFTDQVAVYAGELRCEVRSMGRPAHTEADVVVWVPERRVLFAGDLVFNGGTPFVLSGSVAGSIAAAEQLRALGAEVIVPGHGEPCGPEHLDATIGYLRFVQDAARQARAAGLRPLDAARELDLGAYRAWLDPERIVGNLHRAYAELADPCSPTATVDVEAAFQDMVTFNGGRLRTHA